MSNPEMRLSRGPVRTEQCPTTENTPEATTAKAGLNSISDVGSVIVTANDEDRITAA